METILSAKYGNMRDSSNNGNIRKLNMEQLKEKLAELDLNEDLNCILNQIMEKLDKNDPSMQKIQAIQDKMIDRIETKPGQLPEKYFMARNSLLTDLVELPHLKTIRNFLIAIWLTIFVNVVVTDLVKRGTITFSFHQLSAASTNFHMAIFTWICMFTSTVAVYYAFTFWGTMRVKLISKTQAFLFKLWDTVWLILFVIYCFCFFYFSIKAVMDNSLQIMASKMIMAETIRLFMKTYAFVRSNAPRALKYKLHDEDKILCPEFSQFLYFSFAPTLIYRDSYPRTSHIRWNYVVLYYAELIAALLCMHFIEEYILVPSFDNYDLTKMTWQDAILLMSRNAIPDFLYWLCLVFAVFHATQNAFGEKLRFADRLFYKDWWNANSREKFGNTFSVAIYDWLSIYIEKDMYEIIIPKHGILAKIAVTILAGFFHELVYSFPYRCYYVFLGVYYSLSAPLLQFFSSKNDFLANTFLLYSLIEGVSVLRTGITLEYYVRVSCPLENTTLLNYFIPRTFTCNM